MPVIRIGSPPEADEDVVAVEEPLQVRLGNRDLAVMMRTPGNDDELAAGFLFTEGILHALEDIAEITGDDNSITVSMTREADEFRMRRSFGGFASRCWMHGSSSRNPDS
jgi:formate dehydrogenase accessory protein FdhD